MVDVPLKTPWHRIVIPLTLVLLAVAEGILATRIGSEAGWFLGVMAAAALAVGVMGLYRGARVVAAARRGEVLSYPAPNWLRLDPTPELRFGCDYCADDDNRYQEHVTRIGFNDLRGTRLLRCPQCETLYEETPSGEQTRRLAVAEAQTLFPHSTWQPEVGDSARWHRVYAFTDDPTHIAQLQSVSLDQTDLGLAPDPLVGSDEWWTAIDSSQLPMVELDGTITEVYWGSMNDWAECAIMDADGDITRWTRDGEYRRYVEGLRVRIRYVTHGWKRPDALMSPAPRKVVLSIDIEESSRRSRAIAPGPGDIGYELARKDGAVFHYVAIGADADLGPLQDAVKQVGGTPFEVGRGPRRTLQVTFPTATDVAEQKRQLVDIAQEHECAYDGGEVVGGEVIDA